MKAKIHSFPTMYILGGIDVVEMGQIKVFVQKLGLKQGFSECTEHWEKKGFLRGIQICHMKADVLAISKMW